MSGRVLINNYIYTFPIGIERGHLLGEIWYNTVFLLLTIPSPSVFQVTQNFKIGLAGRIFFSNFLHRDDMGTKCLNHGKISLNPLKILKKVKIGGDQKTWKGQET